jgi:hypothetical protein
MAPPRALEHGRREIDRGHQDVGGQEHEILPGADPDHQDARSRGERQPVDGAPPCCFVAGGSQVVERREEGIAEPSPGVASDPGMGSVHRFHRSRRLIMQLVPQLICTDDLQG